MRDVTVACPSGVPRPLRPPHVSPEPPEPGRRGRFTCPSRTGFSTPRLFANAEILRTSGQNPVLAPFRLGLLSATRCDHFQFTARFVQPHHCLPARSNLS